MSNLPYPTNPVAGFPPYQGDQNQPYPSNAQYPPQPPYPSNQSLPYQQPGYPPNNQHPPYPSNNQQPPYPPNNQQPAYPPNNQQYGLPPNNQQSGYPPNNQPPYPQPGYPPEPNGTSYPSYPSNQLPGYQANPLPSYPGVPGPVNPSIPNAGYPPASNNPSAPGYPPAANNPSTPGYPPASNNPSAPGYPPASNNPSAPGYPPAANNPSAPGYPPASNNPSAPGYPVNNNNPSFHSQTSSQHEQLEGIFSKQSGLSKALSTGLKITQDAINKSGGVANPSASSNAQNSFGLPKMPKVFGGQGNLTKIQNFSANQDYSQILQDCKRSGRLFEDSEFPASDRLLTDQNSGLIVSYFGRSRYVGSEIQWMRPGEICSKGGYPGPEMFVGEIDRFDINQGEIGDCWFLAALANLAEVPECFRRVVPGGQGFRSGEYAGIFRFRFYRFGNWEEVVVDDRLPTRNGKLIYLRAKDPNEFWSPLLEKAYAKLYGSYKALEGGLTIEAAVDFTGGIPEMIDLNNLKIQPENLFYNMAQADNRKAFMSCSLSGSRYQSEAESKGLQARHAYSITKVVDVRCNGVNRSIPLIRMRNPHGNSKEWRGDWSDGDSYWRSIPKQTQRELGLDFSDDGEFYMNFNRDFLKYFGEVEIVHLTPTGMESNKGRQFDVFHFNGMWSRQMGTAGGCGNDTIRSFATNPQFTFSLSDPDPYDDELTCPVIISVSQKAFKRKTEFAVGFRIYKCNPGDRSLDSNFLSHNQPVGKTDQYINLREVSKRFRLPEGSYCVIPSTFKSGEEGEFLVRIFVERKWGSSVDGTKQKVKEGGEASGYHGGGGGGVPRAPSGGFGGRGGAPRAPSGGYGGGGQVRDVPIQPEDNPNNYPGKKTAGSHVFGFAMNQLEKHYPKVADKINKLRQYYNWCMDKDEELGLLKKIVEAAKK